MLRQMCNPDLYHGRLPWNIFEGWYFKVSQGDNAYAFIPGIFHGDSKMEPHSFIQIIDGTSVMYDYIKFPVDCFHSGAKKFELQIGENIFSQSQIIIKLNSNMGEVNVHLELSGILKWGSGKKTPRSMGYYNFIPFMECYSQVCAMYAVVSGYVDINGRSCSFKNGRGYIEKNWGSQFPISWLWVQSNSFTKPGVSLSASIGHIPFILGSFKGFLAGLDIDTRFYEFTSMNGSKVAIKQADRDKSINFCNSHYALELRTESREDEFVLCCAPKDGRMIPLVRETLSARVHVRLKDVRTGTVILEDTGINTGIEYGGEHASHLFTDMEAPYQ